MPASSNSFTVRYTVEIEILSSTATQRRYNSSTSGWSAASASTRAMTRRCSVIRMPVVALAPPGDGKSRPVIKPPSRPIIFLDFQQYAAHAARGKVAEVRQQKLAGKPPAAMARVNRDRKYLGFIRRHSRSGKTDNL